MIVGPCDIDISCNFRILDVIPVNKQVTYERFFFSLVVFVCMVSIDTSSLWVMSVVTNSLNWALWKRQVRLDHHVRKRGFRDDVRPFT